MSTTRLSLLYSPTTILRVNSTNADAFPSYAVDASADDIGLVGAAVTKAVRAAMSTETSSEVLLAAGPLLEREGGRKGNS